MRNAVQCRFLDTSISVREATVELVGKYVIDRPEFVSQYYSMIAERIADTGVSVRKRVVKILRDICLMQPNHPLTSQICIELVSAINDEDSIKELVMKTIQDLWFTERLSDNGEINDMQSRTQVIMDTVSSAESCHEWITELISNVRICSYYHDIINQCLVTAEREGQEVESSVSDMQQVMHYTG